MTRAGFSSTARFRGPIISRIPPRVSPGSTRSVAAFCFYALWMIGGFAAMSYFAAAATAATVALTLRNGSVISCLLAGLMVPLITGRTATRADLFSTVLIAAFVAILWRYH